MGNSTSQVSIVSQVQSIGLVNFGMLHLDSALKLLEAIMMRFLMLHLIALEINWQQLQLMD